MPTGLQPATLASEYARPYRRTTVPFNLRLNLVSKPRFGIFDLDCFAFVSPAWAMMRLALAILEMSPSMRAKVLRA